MEAVKQGSACLGIVGSEYVVLAALKRQPNELSAHQRKLLKIDDHLAIAVAGLNADARTLAKHMRTECLNHRYVYGAGPHLYETCPSGNYNEYLAVAIGARAQSAKTYLEKHHESFKSLPLEDLC